MASFVPVAAVDEVPPGTARRVVVDEDEIAIYNVDGELYASSDWCTHEDASLSEGTLIGHTVECPLHGARFDLRTGKALSLPAVYPVKVFEVRVADGKIELRRSDDE